MIRAVAVVVPASNEQQTIGACLEAVCDAAARVSCPVHIVTILDDCSDRTAEIVASFSRVQAVSAGWRNVGRARSVGSAVALDRAAGSTDELLLASTDADSCVPADWLTGLVGLAAKYELVLGTVVPQAGLDASVEQAWLERHELSDGHGHVHGANLAIAADAYLAIGGWSPLATGEDVDLVRRSREAGLRIHSTGRLPVRTSVRTGGRAPDGFADYLRALGSA